MFNNDNEITTPTSSLLKIVLFCSVQNAADSESRKAQQTCDIILHTCLYGFAHVKNDNNHNNNNNMTVL